MVIFTYVSISCVYKEIGVFVASQVGIEKLDEFGGWGALWIRENVDNRSLAYQTPEFAHEKCLLDAVTAWASGRLRCS